MDLIQLIASEGHGGGGGGGTNMVPFVLIGGGVVAAVLIQRSRMQKAKARVNIHRVHDAGRVGLDPLPSPHSIAVTIRVRQDQASTW
ncbi:MAG: hypothetical protein ABL953_12860 [Ilumatobacteraceae bacterium]